MTKLAAHGIDLDVPRGWEGRIVRRTAVHPHERTRAVVHLATFTMPEERGDFGAGVTDLMRSGDVFVTLFEYGSESLGKPLFAAHGVPRLSPDMFSSKRLQRTRPGQVGCQLFFTASRRPFCLYTVVAGRLHLPAAVPRLNTTLHRMEISP